MHFRICRDIGHHFNKFVHTQTLVKNAATEIQGLEDPHTTQWLHTEMSLVSF